MVGGGRGRGGGWGGRGRQMEHRPGRGNPGVSHIHEGSYMARYVNQGIQL